MITKTLLNHFPGWYLDLQTNPNDYYLVLSDDMDSFFACRYLTKKTGVKIGGFYDFNSGLYIKPELIETEKQPVYVDVSVVKDGTMCIDNHRTIISNHMTVNPNAITDRFDGGTYNQKYCGSTLMLVVALFGNLDELTELEKECICAIDSFYIGVYNKEGKYRHINDYWLKRLGLYDTLSPILTDRDMNYFIDLIEKYHLKEHIYIGDDGRLFTYDDILPHDIFIPAMSVKKEYISKTALCKYTLHDLQSIFVAAETYGGNYVVNKITDI